MKKQLVVALGLTVLATPAFATKARLQALGEDTYGSFYVNDNRNIWLNAAQINNHKDLVTFEWGDTTSPVDVNAAAPRAEGGVYKTMGNLVWGLHLGGASNTANGLRAASGLAITEVQEENVVDVFVGGDAGLKWGANVGYSSSSKGGPTGDAEQESLRTRLGVIAGDIEGYANINIMNSAEDTAGNKFEGKLGYQVGAIYSLNDYRIFADYRSFDAEGDTTIGNKEDIGLSQLQVGAGRATRLNDKATLFTKAQFVMANAENDRAVLAGAAGSFQGACSAATAAACEEYETMQVPVVIGLEYDAATWLVLRASVGQVVWGTEEDATNKRTVQDSTLVNAGATLKFGELSLDGVIGNSNATGAVAGTSTTAGTLRTDVLMSRVGMTYRF